MRRSPGSHRFGSARLFRSRRRRRTRSRKGRLRIAGAYRAHGWPIRPESSRCVPIDESNGCRHGHRDREESMQVNKAVAADDLGARRLTARGDAPRTWRQYQAGEHPPAEGACNRWRAPWWQPPVRSGLNRWSQIDRDMRWRRRAAASRQRKSTAMAATRRPEHHPVSLPGARTTAYPLLGSGPLLASGCSDAAAATPVPPLLQRG